MQPSDRALGIVVARGLAIWFVTILIGRSATLVSTMQLYTKYRDRTDVVFLSAELLSALALLAAALFLWRNAAQFTDTGQSVRTPARPVDTHSATRLIVFGVALFTIFAHAGGVVNFIVRRATSYQLASLLPVDTNYGDLAMFAVGVVTILTLRFWPRISDTLSYPTAADLDDEDAELRRGPGA